jgi:hypothetical protein
MNVSKTNYCSLKDAFKSPTFSLELLQEEQTQPVVLHQTQDKIVEKFHSEISCEAVRQHMKTCSSCGRSSSLDIALNDILNMILIAFLIWVILYKPNI